MWFNRIDELKRLRAAATREPYDWVPVTELRRNDRFQFAGNWFRFIDAAPVDDHRMLTAACGTTKTLIDYLAFEMVKVALPRPEPA